MSSHSLLISEILAALLAHPDIRTKDQFHVLKNQVLAQYSASTGPSSIELIEAYMSGVQSGIYPLETRIQRLLRKRAVRSLSGVSVISLLTKFWGCPGKCIYCPTYE